MNRMISLLVLLGGAICALGQSQTIYEIARGNSDFSTLAAALELTDLDELLACTSWRCRSLTAFAPTNSAFDLLPAELLGNLTQNPEYSSHLRGILLYHVIYRQVAAAQIVDGGTLPTLLPDTSVATTITNGNVFIDNAQVTTPDVQASNGVLHIINSVLLPPFMTRSIAQLAQETSFLSTLVTALDTAGLTSALDVSDTKPMKTGCCLTPSCFTRVLVHSQSLLQLMTLSVSWETQLSMTCSPM